MSGGNIALFVLSNILGYGSLFLGFKISSISVFLMGACGYFIGALVLCNAEGFEFRRHREFLGGPAVGLIFSFVGLFRFCNDTYGKTSLVYTIQLIYLVTLVILTVVIALIGKAKKKEKWNQYHPKINRTEESLGVTSREEIARTVVQVEDIPWKCISCGVENSANYGQCKKCGQYRKQ